MEKADWTIPSVEREKNFDLHPDIRKAFDDLKSYDHFVKRLASVCRPNTKIFEDFKAGSTKAYELSDDYWAIIKDAGLSKKEREKKSQNVLKEIEENPNIKEFFEKFSKLVKVGDLLSLK